MSNIIDNITTKPDMTCAEAKMHLISLPSNQQSDSTLRSFKSDKGKYKKKKTKSDKKMKDNQKKDTKHSIPTAKSIIHITLKVILGSIASSSKISKRRGRKNKTSKRSKNQLMSQQKMLVPPLHTNGNLTPMQVLI